jgi:preprotein translocase subunit SecE
MKSENKLSSFFAGAWSEMKKVTWPTRQETIKYTLTVIGICVLVGAILGLFDILYMYLLERFVF